jgi:hypothetical protein
MGKRGDLELWLSLPIKRYMRKWLIFSVTCNAAMAILLFVCVGWRTLGFASNQEMVMVMLLPGQTTGAAPFRQVGRHFLATQTGIPAENLREVYIQYRAVGDTMSRLTEPENLQQVGLQFADDQQQQYHVRVTRKNSESFDVEWTPAK